MKHVRIFLLSAILLGLSFDGCQKNTVYNPVIYPTAYTTLERTIIPTLPPSPSDSLLPYEISKFSQHGYGLWQLGPGLAYVKRMDIMGMDYNDASVTNVSRLLNFFTMTDVHLTDVQSPAQILFGGLTRAGNSSSYSPVIPYTTQVFDAAVQTINAIQKKQAMDFGLFLGDANNTGEYLELRWYIDILDGKMINPNSDPKSTYTTDYMLPFKASGLDKAIPWYQVLGNHDHTYLGTWAQFSKTLNAYVGETLMNYNPNLTNPLDGTGYYAGVINAATTYGEVYGAGPAENFPIPPKVNSNPDRRATLTTSWISEFFNTTSYPVGHGFDKNNLSFPCYTFEPKTNLPIRVIVLDDTEPDNVAGMAGASGYLDQPRFQWLLNELKKGQAEDKLMIIAAHIPIGVMDGNRNIWGDPTSNPSEDVLIDSLHNYSNLLMWVSGHVHRNLITPMPSADQAHPEFGFWMVETASLRDFPQEFRLFDIVRNSDNTISIFATNVDPMRTPGSPAAQSLSNSIAAAQIFTSNNATVNFPYLPVGTPSNAYNAELVKQLSPGMQAKIKNFGAPMTR